MLATCFLVSRRVERCRTHSAMLLVLLGSDFLAVPPTKVSGPSLFVLWLHALRALALVASSFLLPVPSDPHSLLVSTTVPSALLEGLPSFAASILCRPPSHVKSSCQAPTLLLKSHAMSPLRILQGSDHVPRETQKSAPHLHLRAAARAQRRKRTPCRCSCLMQASGLRTLKSLGHLVCPPSLLAQSLPAWHHPSCSWIQSPACTLSRLLLCTKTASWQQAPFCRRAVNPAEDNLDEDGSTMKWQLQDLLSQLLPAGIVMVASHKFFLSSTVELNAGLQSSQHFRATKCSACWGHLCTPVLQPSRR